MYFDANEIAVRVCGGLLDQGLTVAETDLQNYRRGSPEDLIEGQ